MRNLLKKSFSVPYEDIANYPTLTKTKEAISKYCEESGDSFTFKGEEEVEVSGKLYEIYRGADALNLGYGIWCREK